VTSWVTCFFFRDSHYPTLHLINFIKQYTIPLLFKHLQKWFFQRKTRTFSTTSVIIIILVIINKGFFFREKWRGQSEKCLIFVSTQENDSLLMITRIMMITEVVEKVLVLVIINKESFSWVETKIKHFSDCPLHFSRKKKQVTQLVT
jgi:hypothetical protein